MILCLHVMLLSSLIIPDWSVSHIRLWRGDSLVGVESYVYRTLHLQRSRLSMEQQGSNSQPGGSKIIRLPNATYIAITSFWSNMEATHIARQSEGWFLQASPLRELRKSNVDQSLTEDGLCKPARSVNFVKVTWINLSKLGVLGWRCCLTRWET